MERITFPGALEEFCWPAVSGSKDCKIRSVQWKEMEQDSGSGLTEPPDQEDQCWVGFRFAV